MNSPREPKPPFDPGGRPIYRGTQDEDPDQSPDAVQARLNLAVDMLDAAVAELRDLMSELQTTTTTVTTTTGATTTHIRRDSEGNQL